MPTAAAAQSGTRRASAAESGKTDVFNRQELAEALRNYLQNGGLAKLADEIAEDIRALGLYDGVTVADFTKLALAPIGKKSGYRVTCSSGPLVECYNANGQTWVEYSPFLEDVCVAAQKRHRGPDGRPGFNITNFPWE